MVEFSKFNKIAKLSRSKPSAREKISMPELFTKDNFAEKIELPKDLSFESKPLYEVLWRRRSHRYYKDEPISIADLSKLLYFSLGVSAFTSAYFYEKYPLRMYPTAGALNPIETYVSVQNVEGLNLSLIHI